MAGAEGGGRRPALVRFIEALGDAWRERAAERRAAATPPPVRDTRVPRSRLAAALEARLAVRAGVRLDDFLRGRLARYVAALPVTLEELPVVIDVEAGEPVVRARPRPSPLSARPAPAAREPALGGEPARLGEDGAAHRDLRDAAAAVDALDAEATRARAHLDALGAALADALATGALAARPDVDATAEQRGRPPVPSPAPVVALRGAVAAVLVAVAWRFSGPALAVAGLPPSPDAAVAAAPAGAAFALLLALGAAAAALAFAGVALARAADAVEEAAGPGRRVLLALAAAGSGVAAAAVTAAASSADGRLRLALVAILPFAGALLWRWSARLQRIRDGALAAALAWDRDRTAEAVARGRHLEALEAERGRLRAIEAEREDARRRRRALHRRAIDAERQAGFAARAAARRLDRLCESLASALELDRYLFVRLAAERDRAANVPAAVLPARRGAGMAADRLGMAG